VVLPCQRYRKEGYGGFMIMKKGLVFIGIILGSMSCLFGGGENIPSSGLGDPSTVSKKVHPKAKLSSDIERPLLRPVILKKEDTMVKEQKTVETNPKKEQGFENVLLLLKAEREKLQELEREYKKLEKKMVEGDNVKRYEVDVSDTSKMVLTPEGRDKIGERTEIAGTSSAILDGNTIKSISSSPLFNASEVVKKSKNGFDNDLNQRLVKVVKNVSLIDLAECFYKLGEYNNALQTYKLLTPKDISLDQYTWSQYQIANCYRNMKKFDIAFGEYQRFIDQFPGSDLIDQAKWYMEDVNWWKSWYAKNTLIDNQLIALTNGHESN
jgi:tetratricopeptide (TPR) repeat protein